MAAAGTLSRPVSAQGTYSAFEPYYTPPSPTLRSGSYSRSPSATANPGPEIYSNYRKPVVRPTTGRHATSTQYIPTVTANSPTRIYGTRSRSMSAEDLQQVGRLPRGPLQHNLTAPDLRPPANSSGPPTSGEVVAFRGSSKENLPTFHSPAQGSRIGSYGQAAEPDPAAENEKANGGAGFADSRANTENRKSDSLGRIMPHRLHIPSKRSTVLEDEIMPVITLPASPAVNARKPVTTGPTVHELPLSSTTTASNDLLPNSPSLGLHHPDGRSEQREARLHTPAIPSSNLYSSFKPQVANDSSQTSNTAQHQDVPGEYKMLPPRAQTPVPPNYTTPAKSMSLKNRLRRALSFNSSSHLSEKASIDSGRTSSSQKNNDNNLGLYAQTNKSTDNMSISSTASSASMMLRKMGHGFSKKTKRSFNGLFSGAKSRGNLALQANGVPDSDSVRPVIGPISYVNAEVETQNSRTASLTNAEQHSSMRNSVSSIQQSNLDFSRPEITEAVSNVDGHGSVSFPRLSEEITVEEDRVRRASMHLERPLPIDLAESSGAFGAAQKLLPQSGMRSVSMPVMTTALTEPFAGKGILKRTRDPLKSVNQAVAHDALPPMGIPIVTDDFQISFAPAPALDLSTFLSSTQHSTPALSRTASTTPPLASTPEGTTRNASALKFSPRITIHDTYTAGEYDRRGDIATCNRLTPLLAQRIKEELNAYKLDEMDVAEESKTYTHFFT